MCFLPPNTKAVLILTRELKKPDQVWVVEAFFPSSCSLPRGCHPQSRATGTTWGWAAAPRLTETCRARSCCSTGGSACTAQRYLPAAPAVLLACLSFQVGPFRLWIWESHSKMFFGFVFLGFFLNILHTLCTHISLYKSVHASSVRLFVNFELIACYKFQSLIYSLAHIFLFMPVWTLGLPNRK